MRLLDLSYCRSLTTIPSEIGDMINLTHLYLIWCVSLTTLPPEIGDMINLTTLELSNCESLTTLPREIGDMINLTELCLTGCPIPIDNISPNIQRLFDQIENRYRELKTDGVYTDMVFNMKMILLNQFRK